MILQRHAILHYSLAVNWSTVGALYSIQAESGSLRRRMTLKVNCLVQIFLILYCSCFKVQAQAPADILQFPSNSMATVRTTVFFTCTAAGSPPPDVAWFKDGTSLTNSLSNITERRFVNEVSNFTASVLNLCDLELADSGEYSCVASNSAGEADVRNFTLEVQIPADILLHPSNSTATIRTTAFFTCTAAGSPPPNITWFRNDESLTEPLINTTERRFVNEVSEFTASVLNLCDLELADSGEYSCVASNSAGEADVGIFTLEVQSVCAEETTIFPPLEEGGLEVVLTWPESTPGQTVTLQCPCGSLSALADNNVIINRTANRTCVGSLSEGGEWGPAMAAACNISTATRKLCVLTNMTEETEQALEELEVITSNQEDIAMEEIAIITVLLETVADDAGQSANLTQNFFEVVDNMLMVDPIELQMSQDLFNTSSRILALVERVAQSVPIPENVTSLVFALDLFAVTVMNLDQATFPGLDFSVDVGDAIDPSDNTTISDDSIFFELIHKATASLSISANVVRDLMTPPAGVNMSASVPRITNAAYLNDALFTGREERNDSVVGSIIIAASLSLFDPKPMAIDIPPALEKTLSAISFIGVSVSILFLLFTILTYLASKKLRTSEPGKLLMNLCFGLLGIYVLFIVCFLVADERVPEPVCAVAGGLLHYFLLATFFLMTAEAINLYTKLVIVIGVPYFIKNRYVLKAALISWIVPLFIVIVSEAPDWTNYIGKEFCRPYDAPFWGGVVAPFGVVYIINWVFFLIIFTSLLRRKARNKELSNTKPSVVTKLRQRFTTALVLSLLFGLGWGVGMVATSSIPVAAVALTLQIIFILLTCFQGLLIFVMNCMRNDDAKDEWKKWIHVVCCRKDHMKHPMESNIVTNDEFKKDSMSSTSGSGDTGKRMANKYLGGTLTMELVLTNDNAELEKVAIDLSQHSKDKTVPNPEGGNSNSYKQKKQASGNIVKRSKASH